MAQDIVTRSIAFFSCHPISLFHRILPLAGLGFAVIVNVAWIGFLGFGLFKLILQDRRAAAFMQHILLIYLQTAVIRLRQSTMPSSPTRHPREHGTNQQTNLRCPLVRHNL